MVACGFSECLISQTYLPPTIFLWPHHVWNSTIDTTIINTTSLWSKRAESRGYWSPFVLPGEPRGWEQTCRASLPLSHGLGTWTTVHHTHRLPDLGSASLSGDVQTVGNCRDLKSGFRIKTPPVWSDNTETEISWKILRVSEWKLPSTFSLQTRFIQAGKGLGRMRMNIYWVSAMCRVISIYYLI